jgi:o-succinylbenzoate---CoA ligase
LPSDEPLAVSVFDVLSASSGVPDAQALVGREQVWSYARVEQAVAHRCEGFGADGVAPGDRCPVVVRTEPAAVVELLALWRYGAIPIPLNPRLTPSESASASVELSVAVVPESTQVIVRTSGTSGHPRGVALSWQNLHANVRASEQRLGLGTDEVWLATLSPGHVGWLAMIVRAVLLGGSIVMRGPMSTAEMSAVLDGDVHLAHAPGISGDSGGVPGGAKDTRIGSGATSADPPGAPTRVSLVPTQLHRLLDYRGTRPAPERLRSALIGGAHTPASLVARALDHGWPLALTYGATEMTSQIATAPPALTREKPGTAGLPMPGVNVRFDEEGQILARGATLALGYVASDGNALSDPDGWYRTGDLGHVDDDGHLWITGRRIDRIVSGGVTVDALEVEDALRAHPTIIDACVVGVPDEEWGERVGAWIDPVVGEFELEEVERHIRACLAGPKRPRAWYVGGDLPRNRNGKVDRVAVRLALISRV